MVLFKALYRKTILTQRLVIVKKRGKLNDIDRKLIKNLGNTLNIKFFVVTLEKNRLVVDEHG